MYLCAKYLSMKRFFLLFTLAFAGISLLLAEEYTYDWTTLYPDYQQTTPPSDFTTPDGNFSVLTEKASGISAPVFSADSHNLLLRLYANNTLCVTCLNGERMTAITFVIGTNGSGKLAALTASTGEMLDPYLGKDETETFREYRHFWQGDANTVTFTVGENCEYGYECLEQGKTEVGNFFSKQMLITTAPASGIEEVIATDNHAEVYDIMGKRVEATSLTRGIYIVRAGGITRKMLVP